MKCAARNPMVPNAIPILSGKTRNKRLWFSLLALWVLLVAFQFTRMAAYENSPGNAGVSAMRWPSASTIHRTAGRSKLVMFAHPLCGCTRASIGELARLMASCGGSIDAEVVFLKTRESSDHILSTTLRDMAMEIPGVTVVEDKDGSEAKRFGAKTSGHTVVYDASGNCVFTGGITAARGQYGDNAGSAAIVAGAGAASARWSSTPVFGCPLFSTVTVDRSIK